MGIRVQPPFINGTITIVVPVKDCAEYDFEVKFMAKSKGEVGKVTGVHLPSLADVPGYIPPPITSVMSITYGTNGKPVYGVKTASGVNSACLPAYFEAYDSYTHRLENEVQFQTKEGGRVKDWSKTVSQSWTRPRRSCCASQGVCARLPISSSPQQLPTIRRSTRRHLATTTSRECTRTSLSTSALPSLDLSFHLRPRALDPDLLQQQRGHPLISRCSFTGTTKPSSGCLERLWVGRVAFTSVLPTTVWPSVLQIHQQTALGSTNPVCSEDGRRTQP